MIRRASIVASLIVFACGCSSPPRDDQPSPPPAKNEKPTTSLYERLGKEPAITAVVDDFLKRVLADPAVKGRFAGANAPRLRAKLIELFCAASGGPQSYTGADMKTAHKGMAITEAEFDALAKDLVAAIDAAKVPAREKDELLALVAPMKKDIVEQGPSTDERLARIDARLARLEKRLDDVLARLERGASVAAPAPAPSAAPKAMPKPTASATPPKKAPPFSEAEKKQVPQLLKRYGTEQTANVDGPPAKAGVGPPPRDDLVGHTLALTRFLSSNGDTIDLKDYVGKKRVVLVILRGFAGAVCIHCSTQTLAIADQIDDFKKHDAEVILVYPGEADTVPMFLEAVKSLREGFAPPMPIVLDVDLSFVHAFMIEGSLAKPTSMVIDEAGVVRWAYVGKQPADRPSANDLLSVLDKLPRASK